MDDEREGELIRHAQQGDALAFQGLVERYMPLAWRMVLVSVKDRASAEDVLQDVWLDVWRGLPRFRCGEPFRPWLVTVIANRSRKAHRRTCVEQAPLDDALAGELAWTGDVAAGALRDEARAALGARRPRPRSAAHPGVAVFRRSEPCRDCHRRWATAWDGQVPAAPIIARAADSALFRTGFSTA